MTKPQINSENYHEYYYHVIDKEEKYDQFYPENTIDIDEPVTRYLLDPDGRKIGTNYKKDRENNIYIRVDFDDYVKYRNKMYWSPNPNGDKLYFTGEEELDNKLKDLNIELYKIKDQNELKEKWDKIKKDSIFQGLKDTSKRHHRIDKILDFERLNETNVGKILCHIATIPTYNIFMTKMKKINKENKEEFKKLFNEFAEYTKELKIDQLNNGLVNTLSAMIRRNYIDVIAGKRKSRRNRKSKKGKRSRKARKSRRKSNRRRGRR